MFLHTLLFTGASVMLWHKAVAIHILLKRVSIGSLFIALMNKEQVDKGWSYKHVSFARVRLLAYNMGICNSLIPKLQFFVQQLYSALVQIQRRVTSPVGLLSASVRAVAVRVAL